MDHRALNIITCEKYNHTLAAALPCNGYIGCHTNTGSAHEPAPHLCTRLSDDHVVLNAHPTKTDILPHDIWDQELELCGILMCACS